MLHKWILVIMNDKPLDIIERALDAVAHQRMIEAVDLLVEYLDDLFLAGEFGVACEVLDLMDPHRLPPKVLTGVLMVSGHARDKLGAARERFVARCIEVSTHRNGCCYE
jgi:hypothetical protein